MTALTVLQLDTDFPRIPGDVAAQESYTAPVEILTIPKATVGQVVRNDPFALDITPFSKALAKVSGEVVVSSCGFLAPWQTHLQGQTWRQVICSALGALDHLSLLYPPGEVLIVTFDAQALGPQHLGRHHAYAGDVVGLPEDMPLRRVIETNGQSLDAEEAERDLLALVEHAMQPEHRAILLECTNLPPYAPALRRATGVPVHDIMTEITRRAPGRSDRNFLLLKKRLA